MMDNPEGATHPDDSASQKNISQARVLDEATESRESLRLFESLVRVSVATSGGIIAGYGMGARKQVEAAVTGADHPAATTRSPNPQRRKRPPTKQTVAAATNSAGNNNLKMLTARKWGLSCLMFSLILETSRFFSPTSTIWDTVFAIPPNTSRGDTPFEIELQRRPLTAVTDYVLGGSFAGLAGARSFTANRALTAPFLLRGFCYGGALGLVGGLMQAVVEVAEVMAEGEKRKSLTESTSTRGGY